MGIAKAKGYKKKCDDLYSLIIRSRGECEKCGVTCPCDTIPKHHSRGCPLTTSHIVTRKYSATRTWIPNSQCLCYTCHAYFTAWPKEFSRWLTGSIGIEAYEELKLKAEAITKMDWEEELKRLQPIAKEIGI